MEPAEIECPDCNDRGCDACDGKGHFELTSCPSEYVSEDIGEVIHYAELFEKGLPPVSGGVLDQSHWFIAACRLLWRDQAVLKPPQWM